MSSLYEVSGETDEAISELKKSFGVKTNPHVIRKSLALARVAAPLCDEDGILSIQAPDGSIVRVNLRN
jgi:hypothetical protein